MKYLIVGIGNIGEKYAHTRHNVGFEVLDTLAESSGFIFQDKRYGFLGEYKYKGRYLYFLKPSTYVNLSGRAVHYWLKKLKLNEERLLVIVDDVALPIGKLRLRAKGGPGGHNGLMNIVDILGHQNFARLRIGIGSDFWPGQQVDYVLSEWSEEESAQLPEIYKKAHEIIHSYVTTGLERTMNFYN